MIFILLYFYILTYNMICTVFYNIFIFMKYIFDYFFESKCSDTQRDTHRDFSKVVISRRKIKGTKHNRSNLSLRKRSPIYDQ